MRPSIRISPPSGIPDRRTDRRTRVGGWLVQVAVASVLLVTGGALLPAAPARAANIEPPTANDPAAIAVLQLTTRTDQWPSRVPEDFAASSGYQPVLEGGLLVDPGGGCSSPVPLPAEFEIPCKAHDLGYDLLRYADKQGKPLGPWARQALDQTLDRHMHAACLARPDPEDRAGCDTMARVASAAVDLNSCRQGFGVPVVETPVAIATAPTRNGPGLVHTTALCAFVLLVMGIAVRLPRLRRGHRPAGEPPATSHPDPAAAVRNARNAVHAALATGYHRALGYWLLAERRIRGWSWPRIGTTIAVGTGVLISVTPGLLPRTPGAQAVLTGLLVATALGTAEVPRRLLRRWMPRSDAWTAPSRVVVLAASVAVVGSVVLHADRWQSSLHTAMDLAPIGVGYWLRAALGAVMLLVGMRLVLRGLRWCGQQFRYRRSLT